VGCLEVVVERRRITIVRLPGSRDVVWPVSKEIRIWGPEKSPGLYSA